MLKRLLILLVTALAAVALAGCSADDGQESDGGDGLQRPSLAGVSLGDAKGSVLEKLGADYQVTAGEEAGHFPENYYLWEYADGTMVIIGRNSGEVLEIRSTAREAATNLGVKVGDPAESVFTTYRGAYTEPESIHGGILTGVFKVEDGAALIFDFDVEDGIVNPRGVDAGETLERIILTYPSHIDEDF